MVIGLCGRSGSGKSTVGAYYRSLGINYIDTDIISREVTASGSPCLAELAERFGEDILLPDGSLNRPVLALRGMKDASSHALLNAITHKYIIARTKELIDGDITVIDAPLLFESGLDAECDAVIGVIASDRACIRRIRKRDGIDLKTARVRLGRQKDNGFLCAHCDYIIKNDSTVGALTKKAQAVMDEIKERFA